MSRDEFMASGQWEIVCCNKIGACVLSYGRPDFQNTSDQFDYVFVQALIKGSFHSVGDKSFLQCELFGSRSITQTVKHSNEAGDSTAVAS